MRRCRTLLFWLILLLVRPGMAGVPAAHAGPELYTIVLRATRTALLADGKQSTDLIAEVRDSSGRPAGTGIQVQFQTTAGTLSSPTAETFGGVARARLTSASVPGVAHVTAFTSGGVSTTLDILFSNDPADTFAGNNYILVTGKGYLSYSAMDRAIEAFGKDGGARLTYRNLELTADHLILHCDSNIVRAHDNVILRRGRNVFHATRLYYSLQSNQGYAVSEYQGKLTTVIVSGQTLHVEPSPTPIPGSYLVMPDLQTKLIVVARSITYFPNDRLLFRRPRFFQNSLQVLSLPYYEMPLHSEELFTDQFFSLGTSGFGLELPLYYNLTPSSTGIFYIRHQQQLGPGYYDTQPGWSLDLVQSYSNTGASAQYEGAFGFTGLNRADWGFQWMHNQEFNPATQGSLYLDFPNHNSIISSASLNQQLRTFRWGANLAGGETFTGLFNANYRGDFYAETNPQHLARAKNLMYTLGTTFTTGSTLSGDPTIGAFHQTAETINLRAFTSPLKLNPRTTLNSSFTIGPTWGTGGATGLTALTTLSLDHRIPHGGALNMTY
ncbi:MAG TPA: invasin domain 3-containing protein, partial [Chthonomonadaceae bacterium]|nr:invasin domain 3-containing protein [Chthonomonadaceae bacterium]